MAETRPSGFPLVSDDRAPILQELARLDGRGRIHVLPRWSSRLTWLPAPAVTEVIALLEMPEPGILSLKPWEPNGTSVMAKWAVLHGSEDETPLEVFRLMQDRYQRLAIPVDRRPYLGDLALQHLGLPTERGATSNVYVAVGGDRIDVFSPSYRNTKLLEGHILLDDLS